jgi:hypothetical protein
MSFFDLPFAAFPRGGHVSEASEPDPPLLPTRLHCRSPR